jgi:predicted nucleic acid-binding Zn ribbon protein
VVDEDHRHCKVCGRVCDVGAETCSKACREERARRIQSRRNLTYIIYASIALLMIVLISSFLR